MKIVCMGVGYVGLVTGACLANVGHEVVCCDIDKNKIKQLNEETIPFFEPGLKELVSINRQRGKLRFTTDTKEAVLFGEVIFNCVGTPEKENGSANLEYVFSVAELVGKYAQGYNILVNKSTVPPGTARKCNDTIKRINPDSQVELVSNPEFLAEGKAVHDFTHPDKIVIGAKTDKACSLLRKVYTGRIRTYIPILETDWETAEIIKYANNSFLATKISFINEIANICDQIGADVKIVAQAMGLDYRINSKFLNPGVGYGGSCFPKDVRALIYTAGEHGYDASLLKQIDLLNEKQKKILVQKLVSKFGEDLSGKTITIWGLSFKPQTSDIREASSLVLIKELLERRATIKVYDPVAKKEVKAIFKDQINYCDSLLSSVKNSSAILLLTEWDEFRNINFSKLGQKMKEKVVFDGRNIYEPELVKEEGFEYFGVGRE